MDQTERPVKIPPEFSIYAEKHHIFEVFQQILTALIIKKPDDPLPFIDEYLKRITEENLIQRILVLGPPFSGKTTISKMLSEKFNCEHVTEESIFSEEVLGTFNVDNSQMIPVPEWVELVKARLQALEENNVGWIMDGIVPSRQHALFLCATGYFPNHTVLLKAPDDILIGRASFQPNQESVKGLPKEEVGPTKVASKSQIRKGSPPKVKVSLDERINDYCLKSRALVSAYCHTVREVNADQPIDDVFQRVLQVVCQPKRTAMLQTPRIIFFGPVGSGMETLARMFKDKYKISTISYENARSNEIGKDSKLGQIFKLCAETCTPDPSEAMFDLVRNELENLEYPSRGWILYGYPCNRAQAEYLHASDYEPNRVFFLEVPNHEIVERLTLEGLDPLTGKNYHMIRNPPENEKIKNRLEVHPHNTLENVCYNITQYQENEASLKEFYKDVAFNINAEMDCHQIFEIMESIIVNPIPTKIKK